MAGILIIEDDPASRDLLVTLLGYQGHVAYEANDGVEGLALALVERPDLVITDILMPEMDGYEFVRRLRGDPELAQTQVIFYTATYLVEEASALARACGVAEVLTKPAEPDVIIAAVDAVLAGGQPAPIAASMIETDRAYLRMLANTLHRRVEDLKAEARARARAEDELQRQADRARVQAAVSRALANVTSDYQATLDTTARLMAELIGDACVVRLLSADGAWLELAAAHHPDPEAAAFIRDILVGEHKQRSDEGLVGRAIQTGESILIPTISSDQLKQTTDPKHWTYLERFTIASVLIVPIQVGGRMIGAIALSRHQAGLPYTEDDQTLLQDLADRAGLAISNARLFAEIQHELAERARIEEELLWLNAELERRVTERTAALHQRSTIIDLASDAVIVRDFATDTVSYWNQGAQRLYGWPDDQAKGQVLHVLLQTIYPEPRSAIVSAFLRDGAWQGELQQVCRDGRAVVVHSRWTLQRDDQGRPAEILAINSDITERKRAEVALRESEERFRLIVEGAKDYALFMLDPGGHVVSWNVGAQRLKGYIADEVIGRHFGMFYPPEAAERGRLDLLLRTAVDQGYVEEEGWRVRKDGSRFWASVVITALRDESGRLRGFSKLSRDISERKRWQDRIKTQAERATALAALSQVLAETGFDQQRLLETLAPKISQVMHDSAIVVMLISASEQWLEPVASYHPDPAHIAALRMLLADAPVRMGEGLAGYVAQTGEYVLLSSVPIEQLRAQVKSEFRSYVDRFEIGSVLIVPLRARGRILGTFSTIGSVGEQVYTDDDRVFLQDLADRAGLALESAHLFADSQQARSEAERANQAKSEFLSGMSHELRTPLNAIIGFTGTMLMKLPGPLNAAQEKQLNTVQRSAKHLLALINDLLDLAKIESGKIEVALESVMVQEVIDEVALSLRPLAEEKGIEFVVALIDEPIVAMSDRRVLSQILINLVNNAIKFTDAGEVRIELARELATNVPPAPAGRSWIVIRVSDTGIGIKQADQARLFQEFGRVNSPAVRQREGTGLGLRLSRQLALLLGGQIIMHSEYGVGSSFALMFQESVHGTHTRD